MITLTRRAPTYDPATDQGAPVVVTMLTGAAIRVRGNPATYRRLELVETEAPTLLFVPTTYGGTPKAGDELTWESKAWTVRDVDPLQPDGVTIMAKLVIVR